MKNEAWSEADWQQVAEALNLKVDELQALAKEDPVRCMEKVEEAWRQRCAHLSETIRDSSLSFKSGKKIAEIFAKFRDTVKPMHLQEFNDAAEASTILQMHCKWYYQLAIAGCAYGDVFQLLKPFFVVKAAVSSKEKAVEGEPQEQKEAEKPEEITAEPSEEEMFDKVFSEAKKKKAELKA